MLTRETLCQQWRTPSSSRVPTQTTLVPSRGSQEDRRVRLFQKQVLLVASSLSSTHSLDSMGSTQAAGVDKLECACTIALEPPTTSALFRTGKSAKKPL